MVIVITFIVNSGLNFVLGLLVAKFLGPEEFGRYAIAASVAVVLNTALFEWLRLSTARFYSARSREREPMIRATLEAGYLVLSLMLAILTLIAALSGVDFGIPASLCALGAATGLFMGWFDYQTTLARARFLDRIYAGLVLSKNAAAFALMVGGAWFFQDARLVLAGSCLSIGASLLLALRRLRDGEARLTLADRPLLRRFAHYALPLVAANVMYQLMPFLNRSLVAADYGFAEAGLFALAADMGVRLFATAGSALDLFLFQAAVRTDEEHGRAAAQAHIARNMALICALLFPFAAGLWLVMPGFEALLVPQAYRGAFGAYMGLLIPALLSFGLIQYALNPVFQLEKRTAPVIVAAVAALAINAGLLPILPSIMGALGYAAAQMGGVTGALLILAFLAWRSKLILFPWRDLGIVSLAVLAMSGLLWPLRGWEPAWLGLLLSAGAGMAVYGAAIYAGNVAGIRGLLGRKR